MSSSSKDNTVTGYIFDDKCGQNAGFNLPPRSAEQMSTTVSMSAKYSKVMVVILESLKEQILAKKAAGKRICVIAMWQADGGMRMKIVEQDKMESDAPGFSNDKRLIEYIAQYDMSVSVPIALHSRFDGATDYFASIMGYPWMSEEELNAQLAKAVFGQKK